MLCLLAVLLFAANHFAPTVSKTAEQFAQSPATSCVEYETQTTYDGSGKAASVSSGVIQSCSATASESGVGALVTTELIELNAQRSAAYWTAWIAVFTAFGLVALIGTLIQTQQIAIVTRSVGEAQTRPFPLIKNGGGFEVATQPNAVGVTIKVKLKVSNAGPTPLVGLIIRVDWYIWQPGPRTFTEQSRMFTQTYAPAGPIGPNDEVEIEPLITTTHDFITRALQSTRGGPPDNFHRYIRLEISLVGQDFAGRLIPAQNVSVASKTPFSDVPGTVRGNMEFPQHISTLSAKPPS